MQWPQLDEIAEWVMKHSGTQSLLPGYLVNYTKYGSISGRVTRDAAARKGLVLSFSRAVRTHAGIPLQTVFTGMPFAQYRPVRHSTASRMNTENRWQPILPVNRRVVNNYYFLPDFGRFRCSTSAPPDRRPFLPARFFRRASNPRTRYLHRPAIFLSETEDCKRAYSPICRWGLAHYSDIRLLDPADP